MTDHRFEPRPVKGGAGYSCGVCGRSEMAGHLPVYIPPPGYINMDGHFTDQAARDARRSMQFDINLEVAALRDILAACGYEDLKRAIEPHLAILASLNEERQA